MAQRQKIQKQNQQQHQQPQNQNERENYVNSTNVIELQNISIEDETQVSHGKFFDLIYKGSRRCAATFLGIFIIDKISNVLELVEKTAKWSIPVKHVANNDAEEIKLERPLPWIPFLGLIIFIRIIQLLLSLAAICIGNDPIQAKEIVTFIQIRRQKLYALRLYATQTIQNRAKKSWITTFRNIFSKIICQPRLDSSEIIAEPIIHSQKLDKEQKIVSSVLKESHKHSTEGSNDKNHSVAEMLDKLITEDSVNNSDFIPYLKTEQIKTFTPTILTGDVAINSISKVQNEEKYLNTSNKFSNNYVKLNENGDDFDDLLKQSKIIKQENLFNDENDSETAENKIKINGNLTDSDDGDRLLNENVAHVPTVATTITATRPLLVDNGHLLSSSSLSSSLSPSFQRTHNILISMPPTTYKFNCQCNCNLKWNSLMAHEHIVDGKGDGSGNDSSSSNEDIFYSPIDSPKIDKYFELTPNLINIDKSMKTLNMEENVVVTATSSISFPQEFNNNSNNKNDTKTTTQISSSSHLFKSASSNHDSNTGKGIVGHQKQSQSGKSHHHQGKRGKHRR